MNQDVPLFCFFKQCRLTPIKIRIKKRVDTKLKGKNDCVKKKIPVKTKPEKFKKKKPGFRYFLVNSEFLGKLKNDIINNG
ncbi:MAG: hypothetical protein ACTSP9_18725, partial [Promethearchaeota archaeon]